LRKETVLSKVGLLKEQKHSRRPNAEPEYDRSPENLLRCALGALHSLTSFNDALTNVTFRYDHFGFLSLSALSTSTAFRHAFKLFSGRSRSLHVSFQLLNKTLRLLDFLINIDRGTAR
jgi:hypothetical protein